MISKNWFAMVFALASSLPSLSRAQVTYEFVNGAICTPALAPDASKLQNNTYGVSNITTTQAAVLCPVGNMSKVGPVRATVYDRNSGANQNVCCTVRTHSETGATRWASNLICTNGFGSDHMFIDFGTPSVGGILTATCTIPPRTPANGNSHIASFRFSK